MKKALAVAMVIVSALFAGCGGGAESAARSPDERVATRADALMPADGTLEPTGPYIGAWSANLTSDDIVDAAGDVRLAGEFRLELREDGTYTTFEELDGEGTGRYSAAPGNAIVFGDDAGCAQGGFEGSGVYEWAVEDDELTLTVIRPESGGCTGRADVLTLPRWKRS